MSSHPGDLTGLSASAQCLSRTVDALSADELAAPSLLPGWTRAHVVAHVALNGLVMARAIAGLLHENPLAMYTSDEQRNLDIEELSKAAPSELRSRQLSATTEFADAVALLQETHWSGHIDRLPGGPAWPMVTAVPTRRRELEIHHADLGTTYTHHDWPHDFVADLLDVVAIDQAPSGPFVVRASDLDREWMVGPGGGPRVTGTGAGLGWWLTGRGEGDDLACTASELPALRQWRRAPAGGMA